MTKSNPDQFSHLDADATVVLEAIQGLPDTNPFKARLLEVLAGSTEATGRPRGLNALEAQAAGPRLASFKIQFEALPALARRNLTWLQVLKGMTQSVDELLTNTAKLENAQVFEVDGDNNLVFSDGTDEVPSSTLNQNYFNCRNAARAQGLELFTESEHQRLQAQGERKYERRTVTWLESGENPSFALSARWDLGEVHVSAYPSKVPDVRRGARRLLRVKLNLGA